MAQTTLVVSFLLGVFIVGGAVLLLSRGRFRYTPAYGADGGDLADRLAEVARTPVAWMVGFLALTLVAGAATVLAVGGYGVAAGVSGGAAALLAAVGVAVLAGYLFYGTFAAARSRGLHSAQAAAFGSWALGLVLLLAVAASLLGIV
jgi:hypothetical protein